MSIEAAIRLALFIGAFVLLLSWEVGAPRMDRRLPRLQRWAVNLGLGILGLALVRLTVGALAYAAARWAGGRGLGLLNLLAVPHALGGALAFLLLDLGVYAQHVATHAWAPLRRLHRIHHADLDMDLSTALRFHPLEILLSMGYKAALVLLLGAPPGSVLAFEGALSFGALFTHANGRMPEGLDRALRWILVTPAMHTLHHSDRPFETNANYGFSFSWWDRMFRTYRDRPEPGLTLGLGGGEDRGLGNLLAWPFRERPFPSKQ